MKDNILFILIMAFIATYFAISIANTYFDYKKSEVLSKQRDRELEARQQFYSEILKSQQEQTDAMIDILRGIKK